MAFTGDSGFYASYNWLVTTVEKVGGGGKGGGGGGGWSLIFLVKNLALKIKIIYSAYER